MAESGWTTVTKTEETKDSIDKLKNEDVDLKPRVFHESDVAKMFEQAQQPILSPICMGIYGGDGTCKSGLVIDSRSAEQKKQGKKVVIIDWDGSSSLIKQQYHDNDPNIIIIDPFVLKESTSNSKEPSIDYPSTYNKGMAVVKYLFNNQADLDLAVTAHDGLDTLLKICEYVMKFEDLRIDPDAGVKNSFDWGKRNRRFLTPVLLFKRINCHRFYTTHMKDVEKFDKATGQLTVVDRRPDWERSTPNIMFQKLRVERIPVNDTVQFTGILEKAKGALHLEGKHYTIAKKDGANTEWFGMREILEDFSVLEGA